jgi:hypothetical protein
MNTLPSRHQINDRVSIKFGGGYVGANVVGVSFTEAKVRYSCSTDHAGLVENVDSSVVCDPVSGETD